MFTGLITDVGKVVRADSGRFVLATRYLAESLTVGASIACDGCCLTVTSLKQTNAQTTGAQDGAEVGAETCFSVDVSHETLARTTLGTWTPGRPVNLERPLKASDELGGHMVSGHIDAVARIVSIAPDGESRRFDIAAPPEVLRLIAEKGSVALDGISLTVNAVSATGFGVNLIPHTLTATTWGRKTPGEPVNLEIDLIARYVARLLEHRS